jgi:hypothetical protein
VKLYDHLSVLRPETTINEPKGLRVDRTTQDDPDGPMQRGRRVSPRNRDLVSALHAMASTDALEKPQRSVRVTGLIRILRGHGLLQETPRTHRFQVPAEARTCILAMLAARAANAPRSHWLTPTVAAILTAPPWRHRLHECVSR